MNRAQRRILTLFVCLAAWVGLVFARPQTTAAWSYYYPGDGWYPSVYPSIWSTIGTLTPTFSWSTYASSGYQVAYLGPSCYNWYWASGMAVGDRSASLSQFGISSLAEKASYCWLIYNGPCATCSSGAIPFYTPNFPPNTPYRWGTDNGYNTWTNASSLQMGMIGTDPGTDMNNIYYNIQYYNPNNGTWNDYVNNWASSLGYFSNGGSSIYTYTTFAFPDGVYRYRAYGYDSSGATSSWSGFSGNNYRDGTGPGSWTNLTDGQTYSNTTPITITVSGKDRWNPYNWGENYNGSWPNQNGSGLNCLYLAIDGLQWTASWCGVGDNGSRTYSWNPPSGSHHIQTYATDNAGNARWYEDKWVNICPTTVPITGSINGIPSGNTSFAYAGILQSNTVNAPSGAYSINVPTQASYQVFAKQIVGYSYTPGLTNVSVSCSAVSGPTLTYAQNACPQQPDSNLKAVWHLDETSGQTVADSSGNNYNGTAAGTSIVAGQSGYGNARSLSETSDVISLSPSVSLTANYTIGAWFVYPFPTASGGWNTLTQGGTNDRQVLIQRSNMELGVFDSAGATGFHGSGYIINALSNGWHHLAAVGTGTTTTFYIDGIQRGVSNFKSSASISYLGNYQGSGQQFGTIDEIRIWNRALSPTEIGAVSQQLCATGVMVNCPAWSNCQNPRGTDITCGIGNKYRTCYDSGDSTPIDDTPQYCILQPNMTISDGIMNAPQTVSVCASGTSTPTGGSCPSSVCSSLSQTDYSITAPALCGYNFNLQAISGYTTSPNQYSTTFGCTDVTGPTFWYNGAAGVVSSGQTIDSGSGDISQAGPTPGYRLENYPTSTALDKINYSQLLVTVIKNSGLSSEQNPCTSPGGRLNLANYSIFCYNNSSYPFETVLDTAISSGPDSPHVTVLYPDPASGNALQTINSPKTVNDKTLVIFVNGSLEIAANITVADNDTSGAVFALNNPDTASPDTSGNLQVSSTITQLDGVYVFPGFFSDTLGDLDTSIKLNGLGSLLSIGTQALNLNRAVDATIGPAEEWHYQPKYLTMYQSVLASPRYVWKELTPQ